MPRVLRIINRLNLGGPTFNASYLTRYLPEPFESLLVAGQKDDSEASSAFIPESLGLKPRYIKHMYRAIHPHKDYLAYREIRDIIREYKPDIVHTHAAKPGTVGRLAALHEEVPVILHTFHGHVFHSYFGRAKTEVFLRIERYLASRTSGIIAISDIQAQELGEEFQITSPNRIFKVPLGFDLERFRIDRESKRKAFRDKYGLKESDVAVGIVGRLVPVKNHALFLEAWAVVKAAGGKAKAVIIGDGESRQEVEDKAKSLGLSISTPEDPDSDAEIIFTSWIQDVDRAYSGLDVVALSSLNEGTPVSLIEAQAAAKPVVSTEVGGIRDIVKADESAFLVDKHDTDGFAKALIRLVNDPGLRNSMGLAAESESHTKFSYQRLVSDIDDLYRRLLDEKGIKFSG